MGPQTKRPSKGPSIVSPWMLQVTPSHVAAATAALEGSDVRKAWQEPADGVNMVQTS